VNKGMLRRRLLLLAAVLPTGVTPVLALAHREKTLFTTIQHNARTGMVEIIHRSYAHDVEHTLGNQLQARGGLDNLEAQARLALELTAAFTLWTKDEEVNLELVGAELDGEFFYVYQEAALPSIPHELRIRHLMLRNHWPDMTNFVNVLYPTGVAGTVFEGNTIFQTISASQLDTQ